MSRTRRKYIEWWEAYHIKNNKSRRDKKPWFKPGKTFKSIYKKSRKAKERQAMKNGDYENIPKFRKTDTWNYT